MSPKASRRTNVAPIACPHPTPLSLPHQKYLSRFLPPVSSRFLPPTCKAAILPQKHPWCTIYENVEIATPIAVQE
jgi:hypothetical protein